MDNSTFSKIYGTVGTALLLFAFNAFWHQAVGKSILKTVLLHDQVHSDVLLSTIAMAIVGLFVLWVVERYLQANLARPWYGRIPSAFIEVATPSDPMAKFIRIVGFVCFVIVPAYIAGHFVDWMWSVRVVDRRSEIAGLLFHTPTWDFLQPGTWGGDNRFRFDNADGVSFFPGLEAPVVLLLVGLQWLWTLSLIFRIFVRGATGTQPSSTPQQR